MNTIVWHKINENTDWLDGRDVVLYVNYKPFGMEISARYCKGEWTDHHEYGPEYNGPVWSCFDDAVTIEIEQTSTNPRDWFHENVTHWREPSPPPVKEEKAKTAPEILDKWIIDAMKRDASKHGIACKVTNRQGKIYARLTWTKNTLSIDLSNLSFSERDRLDRYIVTHHFPNARHTSGGGTDHTWRLNP